MNYILAIMKEYGLLAVFIIILLEYACFPVSSEIVLPFSGAIASINHTNFLAILSLSVLAGLIGTGICYTLGWFGGGVLLTAITHKFPKAQKGIDAAYRKFQNNGAATVCIGRVIPLIRTYIGFIAGAAKLNPITYFFASAIGITIWNTLLIGLGYTLRENYRKVGDYYIRYKHNLIPVAILFAIMLIIKLIYHRKKRKEIHHPCS